MVMDPDVVVEATRLVDAANAAGCTVRVMGGVAVSLHAHGGVHPALRRTYRDIDLVAAKKQGKPTLKMLEAAGYEPNERFNAMNGGRRLVVYDMQNGRQLGRLRRRLRDVPQDPDRRSAARSTRSRSRWPSCC